MRGFTAGLGSGGGGGGGAADVVREKKFAIDTTAVQTSAGSIPASATIIACEVEIGAPYDAGTTIKVGRASGTSLLQATADNDPTTAGLYGKNQDTDWGGTAAPVLVTIAGAPAAGDGFVIVRYVETPSA